MSASHVAGIDAVDGDMCPDRYFLPRCYTQRGEAEYFVDDGQDGVIWQPDVYPYAADVAQRLGCDVVIDLGCGRGGKLAVLAASHPAWRFIGIDIGPNIRWCRTNLMFGEWIEADLETCRRLPLPMEVVRRSVVICSDVLEHLTRPEVAAELIGSLLRFDATKAVLSTPARELRAGVDDCGPPRNPSHVREWASKEFRAFLRASGLDIEEYSLTRSDNAGGGNTTQLVLVRAGAARPSHEDHRR